MVEWIFWFPFIIGAQTHWIPDTTQPTLQIFKGFKFEVFNGPETNTSSYQTNIMEVNFEAPIEMTGGDITTLKPTPSVIGADGFIFLHTFSECYYKLTITDSNANEYTHARSQCHTDRIGVYLSNKDAAGQESAYKLDAEATQYDMSTQYTWDGSYVDPTYCDNNTQISMVNDEFGSQETRCILNGLMCTWAS